MFEKLKILLIQMVSYLSVYEIGLILIGFFIFIMLFTLGLLLRGRRFIARFFFFLSIIAILAAPFVLHFMMKNVLYKTDVTLMSAYPMQYTKGFFVVGNIAHKGRVPINECLISVDSVRDEKDSKFMKYFNSIFPKSSLSTSINIDIEPDNNTDFSVIVPNFEAKESSSFRVYVDCYLSNKFAQKMQKKKAPSKDIITPKEPEVLIETKESESAEQGEKEQDLTLQTSNLPTP
ncbi:DUF2393 domain-containing protein [Helicobacter cinaedi]|uniref:DUF2393 domain-containing protein n=1 Tax=Helicobacter cinaedi TaxID=213 RepID=UPI000CF0FB2A|nr:DUF2393 domain-containing protein [Helicobacter cinaedi]